MGAAGRCRDDWPHALSLDWRYLVSMRMRAVFLLAGLTLAGLGCSDDAETCPAGDPTIESMVLTPDTIAAGADVMATVTVHNFELSGEPHAHTESQPLEVGPEPQHEDGEAVECTGGHVHIYLDDLMTNPLTQAVTSEFMFTIPDGTAVGDHVIIGRLHNRDHTILEPRVTLEVDIAVE